MFKLKNGYIIVGIRHARTTQKKEKRKNMKDIIWDKAQIELATGGKPRGADNWLISGISIDSRKINEGDLFIALTGDNFDGHAFINHALAKGAKAALVQYIPDGLAKDAPIIVVPDCYEALRDLAIFKRKNFTGEIIAITGSVGKTSTKEMLFAAFSAVGKSYCTQGNLNNHIGLPLSVARMADDTKFGIFEMGMNHADEISPLSVIAKPDISVITNIEAVHLENFNSLSGIADAKSEIFDGMSEGKIAILNRDNKYFTHLKEKALDKRLQIISFGELEGSDSKLLEFSEKNGVSSVKANIRGEEISYKLNLPGKHQVLNSLAVLSIVSASNSNLDIAIEGLESLKATAGRGLTSELEIDGKKITLIDDTYNASPASVKAAISNLASIKAEKNARAVIALGDMLELGNDEVQMHVDISKKLVENKIDLVFTAGDLSKHLFDALPDNMKGSWAKDSQSLSKLIKPSLQDGDILLIKGSRGMEMENVVKFEKN